MFDRMIVGLLIAGGVILSVLAILVWSDKEAVATNDGNQQAHVQANRTQEKTGAEEKRFEKEFDKETRNLEIEIDQAKKKNEITFSMEIVDLTQDVGQSYFVNYRIKRTQLRQEWKEMLEPLLTSDIQTTREKAQEQWFVLSQKIAQENELENVLKMRGFMDVVAEVSNRRVVVTILATQLQQPEISQIKRITADVTSYSQDKIEVRTRS